MIVCVCNAIREDELRAAARQGAPCPRTAYKSLGCEVQCGSCLPCASEVIDEERADRFALTPRPPDQAIATYSQSQIFP